MLIEPQIQRYSRHILLREVGGRGQEALLAACVDVPRLDEAGRSCALWLARAGVGGFSLPVDRSVVANPDAAGLLRVSDIGRPMEDAVRERLRFHAPTIRFDLPTSAQARVGNSVTDGTREALRIVRALLQ